MSSRPPITQRPLPLPEADFDPPPATQPQGSIKHISGSHLIQCPNCGSTNLYKDEHDRYCLDCHPEKNPQRQPPAEQEARKPAEYLAHDSIVPPIQDAESDEERERVIAAEERASDIAPRTHDIVVIGIESDANYCTTFVTSILSRKLKQHPLDTIHLIITRPPTDI